MDNLKEINCLFLCNLIGIDKNNKEVYLDDFETDSEYLEIINDNTDYTKIILSLPYGSKPEEIEVWNETKGLIIKNTETLQDLVNTIILQPTIGKFKIEFEVWSGCYIGGGQYEGGSILGEFYTNSEFDVNDFIENVYLEYCDKYNYNYKIIDTITNKIIEEDSKYD